MCIYGMAVLMYVTQMCVHTYSVLFFVEGREVEWYSSADCQSYSDVRGYSERGGRGMEWWSMDHPRTVRVTLTYGDTLTEGVGRWSGSP